MDRISSLGAHTHSLARLMQTQTRVHDLQTQVSSGKRSQNYTGIAKDANRLINMEVEWSTAKSFIDRNSVVGVQLTAMEKSIQATDKTVRTFYSRLSEFSTNDTKDEAVIASIQQEAYRAMVDLQANLNISVDGQYVFAGGRISTEPVKLAASSLSDFQTMFDGMNITFPTKRDANLQDIVLPPAQTGGLRFAANGTVTCETANQFAKLQVGARITVSGSTSNDKTFTVVSKADDSTIKLSRLVSETTSVLQPATFSFLNYPTAGTDLEVTHAMTGDTTFDPAGDTITATSVGAFNSLPVGTVFTVAGTLNNNGTYQIAANDGTTITIESVKMTAEGVLPAAAVNATITAESWYKGDSFMQERRVDTDRVIETGILANNTAFEKAFRAFGLIAQGKFDTAGSLENNLDRVDAAMYLLRDVLASPAGGTPPYGTEERGDLNTIESNVAWNQSVIAQKKDKHQLFTAFLETKIGDVENVDVTEASTYLMNEYNALEASFATLAKVRQLSLMDFMR